MIVLIPAGRTIIWAGCISETGRPGRFNGILAKVMLQEVMAGKKRMASEHDGWLGEPFASDFGAAWGIILREDIYDGSAHRTLREATKAARDKKMRYVAFTPERQTKPWGKGDERKLYVRQGVSCIEIYSYLQHREQRNDKAVLDYALYPAVRAKARAATDRWREENPEYWDELLRGYAQTRIERIRSDPELEAEIREARNVYMRGYMPDYYARNPDKLEAKRKADRERKRTRKD